MRGKYFLKSTTFRIPGLRLIQHEVGWAWQGQAGKFHGAKTLNPVAPQTPLLCQLWPMLAYLSTPCLYKKASSTPYLAMPLFPSSFLQREFSRSYGKWWIVNWPGRGHVIYARYEQIINISHFFFEWIEILAHFMPSLLVPVFGL